MICLVHPSKNIRTVAAKTNEKLIEITKINFHQETNTTTVTNDENKERAGSSSSKGSDYTKDIPEDYLAETLRILRLRFNHESQGTRIAALHWIKMLVENNPSKIFERVDILLPPLMKLLSDPIDQVSIFYIINHSKEV